MPELQEEKRTCTAATVLGPENNTTPSIMRENRGKIKMANRKNDVFCADNQYEEALMLMGRVNALAGIIKTSRYTMIECETVAAVLGFDLGAECDEKKEKECTIKE